MTYDRELVLKIARYLEKPESRCRKRRGSLYEQSRLSACKDFPIYIRLCIRAHQVCCAYAANAQTLSNCEPSPPMPPNAKPGIGGLTLSRDGKTLLVATGDGKIRFVDLDTGEIKRTLIRSHKHGLHRESTVRMKNYSPLPVAIAPQKSGMSQPARNCTRSVAFVAR